MSEVHNNSETEKVPTLSLNSDGTGTLDISGCQCYMIDDIYAAVAVINDLYKKGDFNTAQHVINLAFELAKKSEQSSEYFRKAITQLYGLAGDVYGELGFYDKSLRYYTNFQCLKMQLKTNLFKDREPKDCITLFQFRRFSDYTLSNLMKSEITLSRPSVMNDIVDTLAFTWLNSPSFGLSSKFKGHLKAFTQSFQDYRIASFCEDKPEEDRYAVQNPLMWAHYADEHKGFCIEYYIDKEEFRQDNFSKIAASRMFRVNYSDPTKTPINFETSDKSLIINIGFFTKSIDWQYENEVRLIQYKAKNGAMREQYSLTPKSSIVAVYFGYRCLDDNIQIIKKLLHGRNIRYFKMDIDYSNVHRLKPVEI